MAKVFKDRKEVADCIIYSERTNEVVDSIRELRFPYYLYGEDEGTLALEPPAKFPPREITITATALMPPVHLRFIGKWPYPFNTEGQKVSIRLSRPYFLRPQEEGFHLSFSKPQNEPKIPGSLLPAPKGAFNYLDIVYQELCKPLERHGVVDRTDDGLSFKGRAFNKLIEQELFEIGYFRIPRANGAGSNPLCEEK